MPVCARKRGGVRALSGYIWLKRAAVHLLLLSLSQLPGSFFVVDIGPSEGWERRRFIWCDYGAVPFTLFRVCAETPVRARA